MELVELPGGNYRVERLFDGCPNDWSNEADRLIKVAKAEPSKEFRILIDSSLIGLPSFLKLFKETENIWCSDLMFDSIPFDDLFELTCSYSDSCYNKLYESLLHAVHRRLDYALANTLLRGTVCDRDTAYFSDNKLIMRCYAISFFARKHYSEARVVIAKREQLDKINILLDARNETSEIIDYHQKDIFVEIDTEDGEIVEIPEEDLNDVCIGFNIH